MQHPVPVIRRATEADLERLIELFASDAVAPSGAPRARPDELDAYREALAEIAENPAQAAIVAEVDGRVVGTLQFVAFRHLHRRGGRCAEVEAVFVDAAHRSRGIGGALVRWAIDEARRRGCDRVQLTSNVRREDAHRFYERLGFVASHRGFKLLL